MILYPSHRSATTHKYHELPTLLCIGLSSPDHHHNLTLLTLLYSTQAVMTKRWRLGINFLHACMRRLPWVESFKLSSTPLQRQLSKHCGSPLKTTGRNSWLTKHLIQSLALAIWSVDRSHATCVESNYTSVFKLGSSKMSCNDWWVHVYCWASAQKKSLRSTIHWCSKVFHAHLWMESGDRLLGCHRNLFSGLFQQLRVVDIIETY